MEILGIIPARYASVRFPGKPLVDIQGKPMIQHVFEKVQKKLKHVVVATDNDEIRKTVEGFGGKAMMTSSNHISGTSRCIEAFEIFSMENPGLKIDVVINIQGDEPTLEPDQLDELVSCFHDKKTQVATLVKKTINVHDIFNPNVVKVVFNKEKFALYFSRSPIPYVRDGQKEKWAEKSDFYRHIGIYAFKTDVFTGLKNLPSAPLELTESLEQLSWLYHGYALKVKETVFENIGIDTPEDLEDLLQRGIIF